MIKNDPDRFQNVEKPFCRNEAGNEKQFERRPGRSSVFISSIEPLTVNDVLDDEQVPSVEPCTEEILAFFPGKQPDAPGVPGQKPQDPCPEGASFSQNIRVGAMHLHKQPDTGEPRNRRVAEIPQERMPGQGGIDLDQIGLHTTDQTEIPDPVNDPSLPPSGRTSPPPTCCRTRKGPPRPRGVCIRQ